MRLLSEEEVEQLVAATNMPIELASHLQARLGLRSVPLAKLVRHVQELQGLLGAEAAHEALRRLPQLLVRR